LAAGSCTGIEDALTRLRRDEARSELRGRILNRHPARSESRQRADVERALEHERGVVEHAASDVDTGGGELLAIIRGSDPRSVHAYPERRPRVVCIEHGLGAVPEFGAHGIDEPAWMRRAKRQIRIDCGEKRSALALA